MKMTWKRRRRSTNLNSGNNVMRHVHDFFWFWLPPAGYMAAIFVVSSLSQPQIGGETPDYVLHALEYFLLTLLLIRLFLSRQASLVSRVQHLLTFVRLTRSSFLFASRQKDFVYWQLACLFGVLIAVGYGITDEIHQYFVPGRHCSLHDLFADSVGALLAYAVASLDYFLVHRCRCWLTFLKKLGTISSISYAMSRFR